MIEKPSFNRFGSAGLLACSLVSLFLIGCAQTGTPSAPSLKLPTPVADLTARRVANRVRLQWTMPRRTTDKLPLKGAQPVHICRRISDGPCMTVADINFAPEKPVTYDDTLPAELAEGPPGLLVYSIEVRNRHGRAADGSNLAYTASGAAPAPFTGVRAEVTAKGVELHWQEAPLSTGENKVGIQRTLLSTPKTTKPENGAKAPLGIAAPSLVKEQNLVVRLPSGADTGRALDPDAAYGQRYSYHIFRLAVVNLEGKPIEIAGPDSVELVVETRDTFPPAVPVGLAAVAAPEENAVDLSWSPNVEADLAGYAVYRREANAEAHRISPPGSLVAAPAFRDTTAIPGREYEYSVTALDRDGNESARSAETQEALPPKP